MGGLFSKPKPQPAVRMPDVEDAESRLAAERQKQLIAARSGRQSTMLTRRTSGESGTGAYRNSLLGQS